MDLLFAHVVEEASSNSRPWVVLGVCGLAVATLLRIIFNRSALKLRVKKLLSIAVVILAGSAVTLIVIGMVVNLPPAEDGDEFYPSLRQPPPPSISE